MRDHVPVATNDEAWLDEIKLAYLEAQKTIPFARALKSDITEAELFYMAPIVCLKFRAIENSSINRIKTTDAALTAYIANEKTNPGDLSHPMMAFSFCYLFAHTGIEILQVEQCQTLFCLVKNNLDKLK
ncbi:MAG: hypothetical protein Q9M31_06670 [Mariprofundus sp.]|nr:hypothetical protein [Mariprofundus sp.]